MYKLDFHFLQKEMAQSIPSMPVNPPVILSVLVVGNLSENLCLGVKHSSIFHLKICLLIDSYRYFDKKYF